MSLAVRGVQPQWAKMGLLLRNDDVRGIQNLFNCGLARLNDVLQWSQASLLKAAVNFGSINAINMLLNAGAHPNNDSASLGSASWQAWTHILEATYDKTILDALRSSFLKSDDMKDERHLSRLDRIVLGFLDWRLEDELAVDSLDLDTTNLEGMTALAWATRKNDLITIDLLLKAKADPNIPNNVGYSPLFHAARNRNPIAVKLLLDAGVDIGHADYFKRHPLQYMTFKERHKKVPLNSQAGVETIKDLVKAGMDINAQTIEGATPLEGTTICDDVALAEAMLDYGAQIKMTDFDGDTPLMNAILYDSYKTTKLLLQWDAGYTFVDNTGNTTLHHATHPQHLKILEVLLAANLTGINPNAVNDDGKTALQLAHKHEPKPDGFIEAFQALLCGIANRNDHARRTGQESGIGETEDILGAGMVVPGA